MRESSDLTLRAVVVARRNPPALFEAELLELLDAIAKAAKQTKQAITESSAEEKSRSIFRRVAGWLGPGWMANYFRRKTILAMLKLMRIELVQE
jgi:hypothetical protein